MPSASFILVFAACVLATCASAQVVIAPGACAFVEIAGTGTALLGVGDDTAATFTSTIGNDLFPAGTVTVASNGYAVSPGTSSAFSTFGNVAIGPASTGATTVGNGATATSKVLCPFWDDLYAVAATSGTTCYWQELGGVLYIEWKNIGHFATSPDLGGPAITFQIQIFPGTCLTGNQICYVYADSVFGGAQAANDNGASATVGYIDGTVLNNNQWSFNAAIIIAPMSLTLTSPISSFHADWVSPAPGCVRIDICNSTPNSNYQIFATLNMGNYPNGWLYGIDIPIPELINEYGAAPFAGTRNAAGVATIGPFCGLPVGLMIFGLVFDNVVNGIPGAHSTACKVTL
jgi:hypothetical protein